MTRKEKQKNRRKKKFLKRAESRIKEGSWNYRMVRKIHPGPNLEHEEVYYEFKEVHYQEDGWAYGDIMLYSMEPEGLEWHIDKLKIAAQDPVIVLGDDLEFLGYEFEGEVIK